MSKIILKRLACLFLSLGFVGTAYGQGSEGSIYSFSADAAVVSKYMWRGQRLTNGASLQPSVTLGVSGLSFNVWGNMDLVAVNAGDSLYLKEDPMAPAGDHNGLRGKFSEVDYTFSYSHSFEAVSLDAGTILYTFPDRSASLPTTTELYGSIGFDLPLAPTATIYVDVDETRAGGGTTGTYFLLGVGHSVSFVNTVFPGLDISASLGVANSGFGSFYYGEAKAGAHDASITVGVPIQLGRNWAANAFVTYSGLISDYRSHQFLDSRDVLKGTAGSPAGLADTVWGGFSLSRSF